MLVQGTQSSPDGHLGAPSFPYLRVLLFVLVLTFSKFFGAPGKHSCASVVGHARKQSAVWQNAHVCNGRLVHNSSDHGRDHNHWSHGDGGPKVIPVGRRKKKDSNLDPGPRTWLRGHVTRNLEKHRETCWRYDASHLQQFGFGFEFM